MPNVRLQGNTFVKPEWLWRADQAIEKNPPPCWRRARNGGRAERWKVQYRAGATNEASDRRAGLPVCVLRGCNAQVQAPPEEGRQGCCPSRSRGRGHQEPGCQRVGESRQARASRPGASGRSGSGGRHAEGNRLMPASKHRRRKGAKAVAHPGRGAVERPPPGLLAREHQRALSILSYGAGRVDTAKQLLVKQRARQQAELKETAR